MAHLEYLLQPSHRSAHKSRIIVNTTTHTAVQAHTLQPLQACCNCAGALPNLLLLPVKTVATC
jgi:hypothetical protein